MRSTGIVEKLRAGLFTYGRIKEGLGPVHIGLAVVGASLSEGRRHTQQVNYLGLGDTLVGIFVHVIGKILVDSIVYRYFPLSLKHADSNSNEALADRIHSVQTVLVKWLGITLGNYLATAHNQHTVHRKPRVFIALYYCRYIGRGYSHFFRCHIHFQILLFVLGVLGRTANFVNFSAGYELQDIRRQQKRGDKYFFPIFQDIRSPSQLYYFVSFYNFLLVFLRILQLSIAIFLNP